MFRETSPSDRVQLRSRSELRDPGSCALCGSGNCDEGYVDTGIWIEFHGNVYFCMNCTNQIIGTIRALTPEEAQNLVDQSNLVAAENKELLEEVESLREYKRNFDNLLAGAFSGFDFGDLNLAEGSVESIDVPNESPDGSAVGESTPEEPVKGSRPVRARRVKSGDSPELPKFDL